MPNTLLITGSGNLITDDWTGFAQANICVVLLFLGFVVELPLYVGQFSGTAGSSEYNGKIKCGKHDE